jgi:hypothetical protein
MHNRLTSRKRPDADGASKGNTVPAQGEKQEKAPRMPHERDESADSQAAQEPSGERVGRQAREDVERGLVDTDQGPVLDQAYDKVREDADDPVRKHGP